MNCLRALAFLSLLLAAPAMAAERYAPEKTTCDGWPRAPIGMAPGFCAGLVVVPPAAFASRQVRLPRLMLPLPGGDWLVTDLGGWNIRRGAVWRLHAEKGQAARLTPLLAWLNMPHGLARGPDGKTYVGEMSRIFRFDHEAADPAKTIQTVVDGLPDNRLHENRHPLSYFIFDGDGALLVNVGALSDQCVAKDGKPKGETTCTESEGAEKTAGVRRYTYRGNGIWAKDFTMLARGLRNSLALVRHASGTLLQAENSIDFRNPDSPFEELNLLRSGAHYGWPYCYDMDKPAPAWAGAKAMDCRSSAHEKPVRLLPPHASPLGMAYYQGAMFPELAGRLLMSWHGYEAAGARLVAFDVDTKGIPLPAPRARYAFYDGRGGSGSKPYPGPAAEPLTITPLWDERKALRPMGTPVGMAVAADGAIWMTEDKNATILRVARDRP
ncbi:MAG TPA: PQQ-dependent sugar dehydrogenase [Rhizomicrobium sp.]|nr:PQQ-dependent sugar dehydrogenase [Rhizomicrobium sp.]